MPLHQWNTAVTAAAIATGREKVDALVNRAITQISAHNEHLNALVDFDVSVVEPQLDAVEARILAGEHMPLAGVPIAIKDHFQVKGWRCTEGSMLFRDSVADADEPVIKRLRRAGAILVGRSNMSEFGCKGVTSNLIYGATRHPANPLLTPGGSSGGAATAVAAGMVPLALASDGGGSVRRPAAHTGVVGFKPTTGVIGDPRSSTHTSVIGTISASVSDAIALIESIIGFDPRDPMSCDLPASKPQVDLTDLRVAWSPRLGLDVPVDCDIEASLSGAIEQLREAGTAIELADPQWPEGAGEDALMPLQHVDLACRFGRTWKKCPELFDPDIATQIESGLCLDGNSVGRAIGLSLEVARALAAFFADGFDLLLAPVVPCVAWPLDQLGPKSIGGQQVGHRGHAALTPLINHAYSPAISVPVSPGRNGLPVGLQIIGPRLSDHLVLHAAAQTEAILGVG